MFRRRRTSPRTSSWTGAARLIGAFEPEMIVVAAMRGSDVCRELRQIAPHAGIIALVPGDDIRGRVSSLEAGADDCLAAPPDYGELGARVMAVRRTQARRAGGAVLTASADRG